MRCNREWGWETERKLDGHWCVCGCMWPLTAHCTRCTQGCKQRNRQERNCGMWRLVLAMHKHKNQPWAYSIQTVVRPLERTLLWINNQKLLGFVSSGSLYLLYVCFCVFVCLCVHLLVILSYERPSHGHPPSHICNHIFPVIVKMLQKMLC